MTYKITQYTMVNYDTSNYVTDYDVPYVNVIERLHRWCDSHPDGRVGSSYENKVRLMANNKDIRCGYDYFIVEEDSEPPFEDKTYLYKYYRCGSSCCNGQLSVDYKYCPKCGTKIDWSAVKNAGR